MPKPFEEKRYFALALDPIHVGVGGHRLERVDLPVLRDPGTGIPKIPGTSLAGVARSYTALLSDGKWACAGKGGERGDEHCGQVNPACPVCVPFGFSRGSSGSLQGLASIFDAHVLLFPVASMAGPLWVTSRQALGDAGAPVDRLDDPGRGFVALGPSLRDRERLNFGWLLLQTSPGATAFDWKNGMSCVPQAIRDRAVLLSEGLFAWVVAANLETRTSVSIDPETGAAEEHALFTFEAVPRATVFRFEAVFQDGRTFRIGNKSLEIEGRQIEPSWVRSQVEKGLGLLESLGVGGMTTRGMGRLRVLNLGGSA